MKNKEKAVGLALRSLRIQSGLSQDELGYRAQLHRTYIGGVERGEKNPSAKSINKILKALNKTWTDFGIEVDKF